MTSALLKGLLLTLILLFLLLPLAGWAQETPLPEQPAPTTAPTVPEAQPAPETQPAAEAQPTPEAVAPAPAVEAPRVVEIEIVGNERIPRETIAAEIKSRVGEPLDEARVETDRTAVRDLGWFTHVESSATPVDDGVRLTFRVVENVVIQGVEIEGVTVPKPTVPQLLALMKTKPGQVANQRYIAEDIAAMEKAFADQGYVLAQVAGREITAEGVLKLTVMEVRISEIRIVGNKETKSYVIERELRSRPGRVYNARVMKSDLERIYNLGFFDDVSGQPEVGTELGTVIFVVKVVERKRTGLAQVGAGWGSVGGFVGFIDVSKDNWRGTGQRVSARGQFGGVQSFELGYYNPWIAPNHTSLNVSAYNRLAAREAFKEDGSSFLFDERRVGGGFTVSRPLGEFSRGSVTLRQDDIRVENIRDEDVATSDLLIREQSVRALALSAVEDTRDLVANPTRGSRRSIIVETAGLVGGAKFTKYSTDLRHYLSFGPRPAAEDIAARRKRKVLAFRLILGGSSGDPPFLEQYLVGGQDTLRGYKQDRFPGRSMVVLNSEYRWPFSEEFQGVLFVDVGDAWGGTFAEEFGDASFTPHVGVGVGVRVQSPIGPLRLDYGFGSEGAQLHFNIGQAF